MSRFMKLVCVLALAMTVTAIAGATASANRSISTNDLTQNWAGSLTFTDEAGNFRVVCEVLREYIFHARSHAKTVGALVGVVTITIRGCTGGRVRVLGARCHITYRGFEGTLPNPRVRYRLDFSGINCNGATGGFLVEAFFGIARCLYSGFNEGISNGTNPITEIRVDERLINRPLHEELSGASCPSGRIAGTLTVILGGERYTLSLI